MIKYFCDLCGEECGNIIAHRYEGLQSEFGLEIVVLQGSLPVANTHICEGCALGLFAKILNKSDHKRIRTLKFDLIQFEVDRKSLFEKENDLDKREYELSRLKSYQDDREKIISERESELDRINKEIEFLRNENQMVRAKQPELMKIAEAQGYQRGLDECNNPEYLEATARRKRLRGT